jgi:uncharacterized protein YutE (UPF0331/DUF86 family)
MKQALPENWKSFQDFMAGMAGAMELYNRASENGSFVESVCLGASLVDAMLRVGIVLQKQIDERTRDVLLELVFQGPEDKPISERDIYRRALAASVIDESTFAQLQALYDERNRVIHRYIITRITTSEVLDIALRYQHMIETLHKGLWEIEERQIRENVGITVRGPQLEGEEGRRFMEEFSDEKHTPALAKVLRGRKHVHRREEQHGGG